MRKLILIFLLSLFTGVIQAQSYDFKELKSSLFASEIVKKEVQLIDIRPHEEYAKGYIAGASNIDIKKEGLVTLLKKLTKERSVAIYCRSGARSKVVAQKLTNQGYKVLILKGGLLEWEGTLVK